MLFLPLSFFRNEIFISIVHAPLLSRFFSLLEINSSLMVVIEVFSVYLIFFTLNIFYIN